MTKQEIKACPWWFNLISWALPSSIGKDGSGWVEVKQFRGKFYVTRFWGEAIMTKQERRDEIWKKIKAAAYKNTWVIERKDFEDILDVIISEQSKAVAEVVEPLEKATRISSFTGRRLFNSYDACMEAMEEALSKSREYTGG